MLDVSVKVRMVNQWKISLKIMLKFMAYHRITQSVIFLPAETTCKSIYHNFLEEESNLKLLNLESYDIN